jgi:hypothetical protein
MRRRREEKRREEKRREEKRREEKRRVSGGGEENLAGSRHTTTVSTTGNHPEINRTPTKTSCAQTKTLPKSRRPILAESKKLPIQ